jgi:hypothetical protein
VAFRDELELGLAVVNEHHVGIAAAGGIQRLTRAQRDHLHGDARARLEARQQVLEETRVLGGRGRRHHDGAFGFSARCEPGHGQQRKRHEQGSAYGFHPVFLYFR